MKARRHISKSILCRSEIPFYCLETDCFSKPERHIKIGQLLSICLRIGYKCNLKCYYCLSNSGPEGKEYSKKTIISVIRAISQRGPTRLVFSGGEPLLHRDLDEILSISRTIGNVNIVATNGTIFPGDQRQFLADWFYVSCPSTDEKTYRKLRKSTDLKLVKKNTRLMVEKGMRVGLFLPLCNRNIKSVSQTVNDFLKIGIKRITLANMILKNRPTYADIRPLSEQNIKELRKELGKMLTDNHVNIIWPAILKKHYLKEGYVVLRGNGQIESPLQFYATNILSEPKKFWNEIETLYETNKILFAGAGY